MIGHPKLLFISVTNGSLVTKNIAEKIARSCNIIQLVSIEGFLEDTNKRRNLGAYNNAIRAFKYFKEKGACFGFAAMNTAKNIKHLSSDKFIDQMITSGCSVGCFTEYAPCDPKPINDWVLNENQRNNFRKQILKIRQRKPIIIIQFSHDEYDKDNRCSAAGKESIHINSKGDIEPCPFMPIARENIRNGGLIAACKSPFLKTIRNHPNLLQRKNLACSLFEHRKEIKALGKKVGAHSTQK
jgi:MoaA/NifB/PqqE/SkfB family radical SAM enzyme